MNILVISLNFFKSFGCASPTRLIHVVFLLGGGGSINDYENRNQQARDSVISAMNFSKILHFFRVLFGWN